MSSPPNASNTNSGRRDTTTVATDFLNDLLNATSTLWQDQLARWSNVYQRMRQGSYTLSQLQIDLARMWDPWLTLAAFPTQWGTQYSRQLPTLLFIVDEVAETVGPFDASTNISTPPGSTPEVSDLHQIGGDQKLDKKHVQVELTPEGSRVSVKLVGLGSGPTERQKTGITPGLYVGPVYVKELAARRPLALVYVLIE